MDNISTILGMDALPAELLEKIQAAFDKKVEEAALARELAIREEFAARYQHDKNNLVEAMDRMVTDAITEAAKERKHEVARLREARRRFDRAIKEAKASYRTKMVEHVGKANGFIAEELSKSVKAMNEQKQRFMARQKQIKEAFQTLKADMVADHAARNQKIESFVVRQVERELKEFAEDKRAVVEARTKLIRESKKKLAETQARFVRESAKKVEAVVNQTLKSEMRQLHEDLERNRQNMFGRRIFDAVAAEFMTSYLSEGSEVRKTKAVLEAKEAELNATKVKLEEAAKALDAVTRRIKLAEERAQRQKIMGELLTNLHGDKRRVMESMLETIRTDALKSAFDRYLPVVLNDSKKPSAAPAKVLTEGKAERHVVVTGDKAVRVDDFSQVDENEAEISVIMRLAGIAK